MCARLLGYGPGRQFALGRLDVLPTGDLGIQKGFQARSPPPSNPASDRTHNSFIECSIEAGIPLCGNGALRTIEAPSAPSG